MTAAHFVARDRELERLGAMLDPVLAGQGRVCFVTGEAGAGKSTLTARFAELAQSSHEELLVAVGNCNAQTGIGDPYLPFREVLGQLTGDVEAKLTQGSITAENAGRLKSFLRFSGRAVVDLGPDLIDIFVPGAALVSRASSMVAGETSWKRRLTDLRNQRATSSARASSARANVQGVDQGRIFEQFTRVLTELSTQQPIVLLLDDLHWADESSASLLFHLARRIANSRVLVLGTYRPEDVALGRGEHRHPLDSVVNELRREHGEVIVPLAIDDADEGRAFIDALLDAVPNALDEAFRERLFERTRGHPLFTTELLNGMRARGDLAEDGDGRLHPRGDLDWDTLPARVEGVIEERVRRLPDELQELLELASVEGDTFTLEVVAELLDREPRQVAMQVERELDRRFGLVSDAGLERVGRQRLGRYRFRHNLIERYLYGAIGRARREILHEDVAGALERLYGEEAGTIAGRLARHYELAGLPERATDHFLEQGRRALTMYAGGEAVHLLERGLALLDGLQDSEDNTRRRIDLMLTLGDAQWKLGLVAPSMSTFEAAATLARRLGDPEKLARAALGYDNVRFRFNLPTGPSVALLEESLETLDEGDSRLRVEVVSDLLRARGHDMLPVIRASLADEAIAMARRLHDTPALMRALQAKAFAQRGPEHLDTRLVLATEYIECAQWLEDRPSEADARMLRIYDELAIGDIEAVDRDIDAIESLTATVNEPFYDYCLINLKAMRALLDGRFADAEGLVMNSMKCGKALDLDNAEGVFGLQMFSIKRLQGALRQMAPLIQQVMSTQGDTASWRPGLTLVYCEIDDRDSARAEFDDISEENFSCVPQDSLWQACLTYMADVCAFLGDRERAPVLYAMLEPFAELAIVVGNSITCNGAASRSLARLAAVQQDWALAETHFRHAIEFNSRIGALPWLAQTRFQYAGMLAARGADGDGAEATSQLESALELASRIGMNALVTDIRRALDRSHAGA